MQYETLQLQRQQMVMHVLGFYDGKLDGIWGPKSIEAKKRFEASPKFMPAIPANGMPFAGRAPFPNGITVNRDGLMYHDAIEGLLEKERAEASAAKSKQPQQQQHSKAAPEAPKTANLDLATSAAASSSAQTPPAV